MKKLSFKTKHISSIAIAFLINCYVTFAVALAPPSELIELQMAGKEILEIRTLLSAKIQNKIYSLEKTNSGPNNVPRSQASKKKPESITPSYLPYQPNTGGAGNGAIIPVSPIAAIPLQLPTRSRDRTIVPQKQESLFPQNATSLTLSPERILLNEIINSEIFLSIKNKLCSGILEVESKAINFKIKILENATILLKADYERKKWSPRNPDKIEIQLIIELLQAKIIFLQSQKPIIKLGPSNSGSEHSA